MGLCELPWRRKRIQIGRRPAVMFPWRVTDVSEWIIRDGNHGMQLYQAAVRNAKHLSRTLAILEVTIFQDSDEEVVNRTQQAIDAMEGFEKQALEEA
jgi:hypothetical protein